MPRAFPGSMAGPHNNLVRGPHPQNLMLRGELGEEKQRPTHGTLGQQGQQDLSGSPVLPSCSYTETWRCREGEGWPEVTQGVRDGNGVTVGTASFHIIPC